MLLTGAGAGAGVEEFAVEADMVRIQVTTDEKKQRYAKGKVVRIKAQSWKDVLRSQNLQESLSNQISGSRRKFSRVQPRSSKLPESVSWGSSILMP